MTDSMKFGPEWIRTLSESGPLGLNCSPTGSTHSTGSSSVPPGHSPQSCSMQSVRYTLAEHRYGREEMLALYSGSLSPPDALKTLTGLFVEKSQQPLALFSFTDDELRIWNRGVNPDGLGRGGTGKGQTEGSMRGRRDGTGREGRGRGRGGGTPGNYYPRTPGPGVNSTGLPPYPQGESGDANPEMCQQSTFNRSRAPFERQGDRSWSERNGGGDGGGRGRAGGGDTNWRRHRGDEDPSNDSSSLSGNNNNPGWRPQPKWHHQSRSWRDEDSWTDRDPRMSNHHLPEWAMEKNEGGGSFDASGAFHGHDQEDELPFKRRDSRHLHDHQKSKSESSDVGESGGGGLSDGSIERIHEPPEKDLSHSLSTNSNDTDREISRDEQTSPSLGLDEIKKHVEKLERLKGDQQAMELSEIKRQLQLLQKQQEQSVKLQHQVSVEPNACSKDVGSQQVTDSQSQQVVSHQSAGVSQPILPQPGQKPIRTSPLPQPVLSQQLTNTQQSPPIVQGQQSGSMLQQPPQATSQSMVIQQGAAGPGVIQPVQKQSAMVQQPVSSAQHIHQPLNSLARLHHQPPSTILNDSHLDDVSDNIATDLVAKLMEEEEKRDKQWYYKDPQGHVQGPFSCGEMAEWFQSGYFTLGLMVKRACDPSFSPLGELIKIWGCIPFLGDQPGGGQQGVIGQNIQEKERSPPQVQSAPGQPNQQLQDVMLHMKMDHFRHQQQLLLRQQQQQAQVSMAGRNQVKIPSSEWPEHIPPQQDNEGGEQASVQLRALLHQMQAQQQLKQQQQSTKGKESGGSGGGGGGGAVMETLMSLHQQQVAQQAALQQLQQAAQLAEGAAGAASIRSLVSQMQQGKLRVTGQQPNIDSVWNGGSSWKQWSQVNPKSFKTEQQVLEEQMRAEDERKREEIRKQEEAVRLSEDDSKERKREKHDEKVHNERNKRESDDVQRRRIEEEEIRRKQEAARRAEVERQRKDEEKRKKDEEKRRKDEEKRKQLEERERLKLDEHRKKKEAEEAKKRQQDLMSKIQRAQWCPPQASNTSLLEIQRSEREQQVLRSMRDQQAQEAAAAAAAEQAKTSLHLKWTETNRCPPSVESLAEIQAQQYRQFIKVQEKEKAEREKKEAAVAAANQQVSGTWSQGLNWGSSHPQPVWHTNQGGGGGLGGFWDQLAGPKQAQAATNPAVSKTAPVGVGKPPGVVGNPVSHQQQQQQQQQQVAKENKSKAKREEMALLQLFGPQNRQDDFTQWCQQTLANLPMSCPLDIPTFVSFLRDIESGPDVLDYVRGYVGESKEAMDFARQFLERRHTLQQQGVISQQNLSTGHQPALSHHSTQDFQQVKSKGKNKKKARVAKAVDPRILGFSSTASPDRINVGDREYPEDV